MTDPALAPSITIVVSDLGRHIAVRREILNRIRDEAAHYGLDLDPERAPFASGFRVCDHHPWECDRIRLCRLCKVIVDVHGGDHWHTFREYEAVDPTPEDHVCTPLCRPRSIKPSRGVSRP